MQSAQTFIDATLARSRRLESVLPSIAHERRASVVEIADRDIATRTAETWKYTPIAPFLSQPFAADMPPTDEPGCGGRFLTFDDARVIAMHGARPAPIDWNRPGTIVESFAQTCERSINAS